MRQLVSKDSLEGCVAEALRTHLCRRLALIEKEKSPEVIGEALRCDLEANDGIRGLTRRCRSGTDDPDAR